MTREEITRKIEAISQEVYNLGRECTEAYREDNNVTAASLFYALGEFLKHTSFTIDSFQGQIEIVGE